MSSAGYGTTTMSVAVPQAITTMAAAPAMMTSPQCIQQAPVQTMAAPQYMRQAPVQTMAASQYMQQAPVQTMAAPQYMQQTPVQTFEAPQMMVQQAPLQAMAAPQYIGKARTLAPTGERCLFRNQHDQRCFFRNSDTACLVTQEGDNSSCKVPR